MLPGKKIYRCVQVHVNIIDLTHLTQMNMKLRLIT